MLVLPSGDNFSGRVIVVQDNIIFAVINNHILLVDASLDIDYVPPLIILRIGVNALINNFILTSSVQGWPNVFLGLMRNLNRGF